jgi:microcin C transport system substrate-binding protein
MCRIAALALAIAVLGFAGLAAADGGKTRTVHALSLIGEPKYGPDFKQLDYVNPDAPKGGELRDHSPGGFDSLNPYIVKGEAAPGIGLIYQSLTTATLDDTASEYGLIAQSIEVPDDLSWVAFTLRPEARWNDGQPITADDVIWSFETLKSKGEPTYRYYYANVDKAEALGPRKVKFHFSGPRNRELPQIMGQLPVLPKHWWASRDFEKTSLEPPLGSGPYRVKSVDPNRSITYERVPDYWGKDLPTERGRYNFATLRFDMYRDESVALEAFKAHQYDFRAENIAKVWATEYDFPAARQGLVIKQAVPHKRPTGMQAFVFNTRRPIFADPAVRRALGYAFDFEWTNKNLFFGQYTRTTSYFSNSEFASSGLPSPDELKLLEPFRAELPAELFSKPFELPKTDGAGLPRENLKTAQSMLEKAGWTIKDGKLAGPSGQPLNFEILIQQPDYERIFQPFIRNLTQLGVQAQIRLVDSAQYQNRVRNFDFDMILGGWPESDSPGNEQREFWSSAAADRPGSRNTAGIKSPVVDALIDKIVAAPDRAGLIVTTRALDRVLLRGYYTVPNWHLSVDRIAYWNKFGRPATNPAYGVDTFAWWIDAAKEAALRKGEPQGKP